MEKKYGFCVVFVWFFKEISLWKKCLFSKMGYSTFPCWDLRSSKGGKYFHIKCKRTWKMYFPILGLLTSIMGNFYLPKLEKPYLHIWLTTYPKAEK